MSYNALFISWNIRVWNEYLLKGNKQYIILIGNENLGGELTYEPRTKERTTG